MRVLASSEIFAENIRRSRDLIISTRLRLHTHTNKCTHTFPVSLESKLVFIPSVILLTEVASK